MDIKHCLSCALPLDETNRTDGNFCKYCIQPDGRLKSREEVTQGIAEWMKMWQPDLDEDNALQRATAYMRGMPAWADN